MFLGVCTSKLAYSQQGIAKRDCVNLQLGKFNKINRWVVNGVVHYLELKGEFLLNSSEIPELDLVTNRIVNVRK